MAWDSGYGNIVAGIRIALTIYDTCLVEENSAGKTVRGLIIAACWLTGRLPQTTATANSRMMY